jgi:hypothetical protein
LEATGRDIFYSLCEWGRENPAVWGAEIGAQSWRISGDIRDDWNSIKTRAEIGASLWRFSGPGKGWNDPDMLEVGNGGCSVEEYKTHMALWAMLKAPLIVGNDIRTLINNPESDILRILTNKEIIGINQDSLGLQGRIVWSDTKDLLAKQFDYHGERLIATKCSSGVQGVYEDAAIDQQWTYQTDGTIKSVSLNACLQELPPIKELAGISDFFNFTVGLRTVTTTTDCASATKWDIGQYIGGSIVSRDSKLCLEVEKMEYIPIVQGKRVQTAPCQTFDVQQKTFFDVREHQSWTTPYGTLRNLYQRQCLTVDRDAYPGVMEEIWMAPIENSGFTVLMINKGPITKTMELTIEKLGLDSSKRYKLRDLWAQSDLTTALSTKQSRTFIVQSHASVMLKLTEA